MWLKFAEKVGKKVIDRACFQSFGCQTAIAVASVATQLLRVIAAHPDLKIQRLACLSAFRASVCIVLDALRRLSNLAGNELYLIYCK